MGDICVRFDTALGAYSTTGASCTGLDYQDLGKSAIGVGFGTALRAYSTTGAWRTRIEIR